MCNVTNRSSDSAKYTNKSSGTSVLSGCNTNSFHTKFYNKGARHHENERQSQTNINKIASVVAAVPVHNNKKFVAKSNHCESSNHFLNRFITNNNNAQAQFSNGTQNNNYNHNSNNNHYSLSLNRHTENHNNVNHGVGCNIGILTSPYAFTFGNGNTESSRRGTKSDIGVPNTASRKAAMKSLPKSNNHYKLGLLPSVHSDLSIYETTFKETHPNLPDVHKDFLNNNYNPHHIIRTATTSASNDNAKTPMATPSSTTSSAIMSLTKTGSKLLYTNKHRLDTVTTPKYANNNNNNSNNNKSNRNPLTSSAYPFNNTNIVSHQGPLIYKNDDELMRCDWNNSVFDNPIMSVS